MVCFMNVQLKLLMMARRKGCVLFHVLDLTHSHTRLQDGSFIHLRVMTALLKTETSSPF